MRPREAYAYTAATPSYAVQLSTQALSVTTKADVESYLWLDRRTISLLSHATASIA
jgi:hypothetical protein